MTSILIVDDHPIFCMGLRELLNSEKDFRVCALAEDIAGARQALAREKPDMAIIDISLARDNGLDLVKEISSGDNPIPTLVLSLHDETVWAERALRAGARGYIMKKEASELVITALRNIRDGKIHISEGMIMHLLDRFQGHPEAHGLPTTDVLTDRELEVFRLIGQGLSTREIAERMYLGIKTIGTYRDRIKQKLRLKSGMELTRKAVLWAEKELFLQHSQGK